MQCKRFVSERLEEVTARKGVASAVTLPGQVLLTLLGEFLLYKLPSKLNLQG